MVTVAPATALPSVAVMRPLMAAVVFCAMAGAAATMATAAPSADSENPVQFLLLICAYSKKDANESGTPYVKKM